MAKEFKTEGNNILKDSHILVIGGAGYVGSVLVRKLLSEGFKVRVLDKLIYDNGSTLYELLEEDNFSFMYGDFGNEILLSNALDNITDVVLLAALVGDPICKKYPELARNTNITNPKKLVQQMIGKKIKKFVFTSTCSNYGLRHDDSLATEDSELNPQSLYAESKVEFEKYVLGAIDGLDFSPVIMRLSTAFGMSKRMRFDLTISEFTRDLALGKELVVYDENTWRPYCNVSDISDAIIRVVEAPADMVTGQVFNVGSDTNNYTKKMILDLISKHIKNCRIEYRKGGSDPRNYRVSFDKISKILGFEAKYSAEDSIKQLIKAVDNKLFIDIESRKNFYGNYFLNE